MKHLLKTLLLFLSLGFSGVAADPEPLVFGMSTALSGPASSLGISMREGVDLAFRARNAQGGLKGRPLSLLALDDSYTPETTVKNTRQLLANPAVLGFIGHVGTPTTQAILPLLCEEKTLLLAPFSGSSVLRQAPGPSNPVFHLRASYAAEVEEILRGFLALGIRVDQLAFFIQDDSYGQSVYQCALATLENLGYGMAAELPVGRYTRNTVDVDEALVEVLTKGPVPKAVILVGTHAPCAAFIRAMKTTYPRTLFANISFVGTEGLIRALGREAHNVIITQVVPQPAPGETLPGITAYHEDLKAFMPGAAPNLISLEGYLVGRTLIAALERSPKDLTRARVLELVAGLSGHDPGLGEGISISFGPEDHEGLSNVWPTIVKVTPKGEAVLKPFGFERKELE